MLITKKSQYSGKTHTLEINVTEEQIADWKCGTLIQNAMPNVPKELREFIKTGITPDEWNEMFANIEEE